MDFEGLLRLMVEKGASDLFVTAGVPPSLKVNGQIVPISKTPLSPDKTRETVLAIMTEGQRKEFYKYRESNFALSARGVGRFRVSAFYQRNLVGMVLRRIETNIPRISDLGLPNVLKDVAMSKRGIVFFVGATGAGKSTSLASMIGHRNHNSKGHIISIEDPIEYIHQHAGCIVTQREVGLDTESFEVSLKNALRQAPDVIMIGEVRTLDAMEYAVAFAETGHLVMATLHANNANQALDRIVHFFPAERHQQLWLDLSLNLRAIIAQQLVPTKDGTGRRACVEIMLNTPLVADHIRKGEVHMLKARMSKSGELGMQTFDQALYKLYKSGSCSYEDCLAYADSPNDLRLMIKLGSSSPTEATAEDIESAGVNYDDLTKDLKIENDDDDKDYFMR